MCFFCSSHMLCQRRKKFCLFQTQTLLKRTKLDEIYWPMQANPVGLNLKPLLHWHLKLPSMLMQMPLEHMPISLHSSWSVQIVPSGDKSKPAGQMQLKPPGELMQRPLRHFPSLHSLMSAKDELRQLQWLQPIKPLAFTHLRLSHSVADVANAIVAFWLVHAFSMPADGWSEHAFVHQRALKLGVWLRPLTIPAGQVKVFAGDCRVVDLAGRAQLAMVIYEGLFRLSRVSKIRMHGEFRKKSVSERKHFF